LSHRRYGKLTRIPYNAVPLTLSARIELTPEPHRSERQTGLYCIELRRIAL